MWRNFREIWEILEIFWEILGNFEKFWELLGAFNTIYALICGIELSPKSTIVEKKWQIWGLISFDTVLLVQLCFPIVNTMVETDIWHWLLWCFSFLKKKFVFLLISFSYFFWFLVCNPFDYKFVMWNNCNQNIWSEHCPAHKLSHRSFYSESFHSVFLREETDIHCSGWLHKSFKTNCAKKYDWCFFPPRATSRATGQV